LSPQDVLSRVTAMGYRLCYRPGGLRITGNIPVSDEVRSLIAGNRESLIAFLAGEAKLWAAMEASLAAGRVTTFPEHLHRLVQPALVKACQEDEARLKGRKSRLAPAGARAQ
jgi:hypothetical protein